MHLQRRASAILFRELAIGRSISFTRLAPWVWTRFSGNYSSTGLLLLALFTCCLALSDFSPGEPRWGGHSLSFWIDQHDIYNRLGPDFLQEPPAKVEFALDELTLKALPWLLKWLTVEDAPLRERVNRLLHHQRWITFRYEAALGQHCKAATGFCLYSSRAALLQPALLKLIAREPPDSARFRRFCGAFFFTRPPKKTFLPLCYELLSGPDWNLRQLAAQWLAELCPDEARVLVRNKQTPSYLWVADHLRIADDFNREHSKRPAEFVIGAE